MILRISRPTIFATPLALALAVSSLACSSSSSPSTGDDAGSPDSSSSTTPDSSASTTSDSSASTAPDSSTSTAPDSSTSTTPDSSTSTTPDSSTSPDSSTTSTNDAGALSFATDIYAPIIAHDCVGCHGGTGSGVTFGKLDMSSADTAYTNLVNVAAAGAACGVADGGGPIRVVPGSAETSLLYEKVNGFTTPPPCGHAMPESGEIADGGQAIVVEQIEAWINEGALP